ncbi:MAG: hypothetical protein GF311_05995 [Candidatus Lokiarchaeota archaeon]|nr:hypothetical protein [Candidatus Lokiarchaeota archaeon]
MPEQSKKYYSAMKSKILERFSYLLDIMKIELLEYFESDLLNRMLFEFKELYNDSLSEIPYIGGKKNLFTRNVAYSSPSIIFWKVLKAHNFPIEKFAPIYLKALKINVEQEYKGIKGLLKRMLQKILIRKTFLRFMWKNQAKITDEYPKNFIAKPIKEKKGEFDFGYIMTQCPIVEFGKSQNA